MQTRRSVPTVPHSEVPYSPSSPARPAIPPTVAAAGHSATMDATAPAPVSDSRPGDAPTARRRLRRLPMQPATDLIDLVAAVRTGTPGAWDDLVARLLPTIRAAVNRFDTDLALRDDAESEALRALFENLDAIEHPERLPGWIARVASNAAVDLIRVDQRQREAAMAEAASTTLEMFDRDRLVESEVRAVLADAVGRLNQRERIVVTSRLLTEEPEPLKSIQARTGVPSGAIGPTLGRSLSKLRRDPALRHLLA
ncbi:MAG: sigma-70 family RNA polymerase sigma factor [Actinomycetota bacterium]